MLSIGHSHMTPRANIERRQSSYPEKRSRSSLTVLSSPLSLGELDQSLTSVVLSLYPVLRLPEEVVFLRSVHTSSPRGTSLKNQLLMRR